MTSPSIKGGNPISLCQAFRAVIPAALTVFYNVENREKKTVNIIL